MRAFVTGGSGFLGSTRGGAAACARLAGEGARALAGEGRGRREARCGGRVGRPRRCRRVQTVSAWLRRGRAGRRARGLQRDLGRVRARERARDRALDRRIARGRGSPRRLRELARHLRDTARRRDHHRGHGVRSRAAAARQLHAIEDRRRSHRLDGRAHRQAGGDRASRSDLRARPSARTTALPRPREEAARLGLLPRRRQGVLSHADLVRRERGRRRGGGRDDARRRRARIQRRRRSRSDPQSLLQGSLEAAGIPRVATRSCRWACSCRRSWSSTSSIASSVADRGRWPTSCGARGAARATPPTRRSPPSGGNPRSTLDEALHATAVPRV